MGGLSPIASAVLPVASTALTGYQQQQYRAQNDAADRTYQERERQLQWQREDELRRQDQELERQKAAADAAAEAQQRRSDMTWLTRSQNQEAMQMAARQDADRQAAGADAQTRLATLAQQSADDERRRRDALRRSVARTRADLGGQGVSSADGSGEAILLGLVGDTAQESASAAQVDQLKRQAIQQELDNARRRNLLEQAQLAQRQRLDFMSKFF